MRKNSSVPIWEKFVLSVEEAAEYFRIGENKLRNIISENPYADWLLWNNNRAQIKRRLFEDYIESINSI
ncbi:MAG: excisionase [Clostridia bacterium]|nr:excisionase [Clostridia bacterium]